MGNYFLGEVGSGIAKNCFRNFFNTLLLNTFRQRAYT